MEFELKLSKPSVKKSWVEGVVMGVSYFVGEWTRQPWHNAPLTEVPGGLLPMIPYFIFVKDVNTALFTSIGVTAIVLLAFGYTKAKLSGTGWKDALWGAVQTLLLGSIAAGVAYGIVKAVDGSSSL